MAKKSEHHILPDDTVYDILVRLPVKILCRFKCTCKSWCSVISSPQFQADHYCHAQKNPLILAIQVSNNAFTIHLSSYNSNEGTLVKEFVKSVPYRCIGILPIQSCLGLVCITPLGDPKESGLIIYSPSSNALLSLPPAPGFNLCVGFGYAYSTNEFKVVRFFHDKAREPKFRCGVFTLGTHEWRDAGSPPYNFARGCAPFLHGAVHFLPYRLLSVQEQDHIAAFDIESEGYKVISLPQFYFTMDNRVKRRLSLTELGGSLCLPNLDRISGDMELWLLKDYHNGEWIKGYTIQFSQLADRTILSRITPRPLAIRGDGSILLSIDLELNRRGHKVLCYNPKDRVLTQMIEHGSSAMSYEETFLALRNMQSYGGSLGENQCVSYMTRQSRFIFFTI